MKTTLPIFNYTLKIKNKTKTNRGKKEWTVHTCSALPPEKNPRIKNKVEKETGKSWDDLIIEYEKGAYQGHSFRKYEV